MEQKTCKYNSKQPADRECFLCGEGLCSAGSCGYYDEEAKRYICNECWPEYQEQYLGICPECKQELEPIMENNGFAPPDPTHYEITGYKPCNCGQDEGGDI